MAPTIATPRDLLVGLFALQAGRVDHDQLADAFLAWTRAGHKTLAEILLERGVVDEATRSTLEAMAEVRLRRHDPAADVAPDAGTIAAGIPPPDPTAPLPRLEETVVAPSPAGPFVGPSGGLDPLDAIEPTISAPVGPETVLSPGGVHSTATLDWDPGRPECPSAPAIGMATGAGKRFRVLRHHAQGGLGAVYVALDVELDREVALKQILDRLADDPTARARFLVEARITGQLEHPGIVPVYGLGHHPDGRPYYAMRFIEGDSLEDAIAAFHADPALKAHPGRRSLALRMLLRRFVDVCNAVDYAHGRGVLHRDLKPANVIVGNHGETLVVDWGVAKRIGRPEPIAEGGDPGPADGHAPPSSAGTLPGSAVGTPAYMSPEQAAGDLDRLGPASDVYSLGATLYALLTGRQPFRGPDVGTVLRDVQGGRFVPPTGLDPGIDRALEAVCLKAMARLPGDRYPTARALGEDVDRWSAEEPVSAWCEPFPRRARRWARRNRPLVTAAAAGLVAGLVGLASVLAVQIRAKDQIARSLERETEANRSLADANAELTRSKRAVQERYDLAVEAIRTFHTGVSGDFLLKQDQFKDLRDRLLKSASDFYQKLGEMLRRSPDLASRRALASANDELANLTRKVGRVAAALEAHRAVLAAREAISAETGAGPEATVDLARSLVAVAVLLAETGKSGDATATFDRAEALLTAIPDRSAPARSALAGCRMRMGEHLLRLGRDAKALETLRLARSDLRELADAPTAPDEARAVLATATTLIGHVLQKAGDLAGAEAEYREALEVERRPGAEGSSAPDFRERLANGHLSLGGVLQQAGRTPEAEAEYRAAVALLEKLSEENPAVAASRRSLAAVHNRIGYMLARTGRTRDAEAEHREALRLWARLAEVNPTVTELVDSRATGHIFLGMLLEDTGHRPEAEAEYHAAVAIHGRLVAEHPTIPSFRNSLANSRFTLGALLLDTGRASQAEAEYRAAIEIQGRLAAEDPKVPDYRYRLGSSHEGLGDLMSRTNRPLDAEAEYRAAIEIHDRLVAEHPTATDYRRRLARSRTILGLLLFETGRPDRAEAEYRAALAVQARLVEEDPPFADYRDYLAVIRTGLGVLLAETGRPGEAEAEHRAAMALQAPLVAETPSDTNYANDLATIHANLGDLLAETGRPAGAEAEQRAALAFFERLSAENPAVTGFRDRQANAYLALGRIRWNSGDPSGALALYRRSLEIVEPLAELDPDARVSLDRLARVLSASGDALLRLGDPGAARRAFERARAMEERLASAVPSVPAYRRELAVAVGRLGLARRIDGDTTGANSDERRALEILEALPADRRSLYALAGCRASVAGVADAGRDREADARLAVATLSRAIDDGYRDRGAIGHDPALDPLRGRDDFRLLMLDLAFPSRVFSDEDGPVGRR